MKITCQPQTDSFYLSLEDAAASARTWEVAEETVLGNLFVYVYASSGFGVWTDPSVPSCIRSSSSMCFSSE